MVIMKISFPLPFPRIIQKANLLILKCERNSFAPFLPQLKSHFYSLPPLVAFNYSMLFHFLPSSGFRSRDFHTMSVSLINEAHDNGWKIRIFLIKFFLSIIKNIFWHNCLNFSLFYHFYSLDSALAMRIVFLCSQFCLFHHILLRSKALFTPPPHSVYVS